MMIEMEKETVLFYENGVPALVAAAMESLYANIFSSTLAEHCATNHVNAYLFCYCARVETIILFQITKQRITVMNGDIHLTFEELEKFQQHIFNKYKNIKTILFQSILLDEARLSRPCQCYRASEDIVLSLPESPEHYLAQLGKSTKKILKYHQGRSQRHFPTMSYAIYRKKEIDDRTILDIIELNTARMHQKNRLSTLDQAQRTWLLGIAKSYGFVTVTLIDGRVCAGVICSRVGKNYFMHVIAHDPAYDDARLGMLCCYRCINEAIRDGGKEFHFLWGEGEYKYRLGGVRNDLHNLLVYRSHAARLLQGKTVVMHAFSGLRLRLRTWLKQRAAGKGTGARMLGIAIRHLSDLYHHGKFH
jgi:hypothetical protein